LFYLICRSIMAKTETVFLSIGSNLGNKKLHLQKAIFLINTTIGTVSKIAPIYQSPSWGFPSDDFYNSCITLETSQDAFTVLQKLQAIEKTLGRTPKTLSTYESRIIDLDILYFGKDVITTKLLNIPHPRLAERAFVLKPLTDIAPQFRHPSLKKDSRNLLQQCSDKSILTKTNKKLYASEPALMSSLQFITIEGTIGVGKTSLTKKIATEFNAKLTLERFAENPFLPKFYKDPARYAFPLEMSFLVDRHQQFIEDTGQFNLFKNFMISDYDIFKSLVFAKITLQYEEFNLYRKLFCLMHQELRKPRIFIYLHQTTERLLEQIKKRGRAYEQDITKEYLDNIHKSYINFLKTYPKKNKLIIDVSNLDFVNNKTDYQTILNRIQEFAICQDDD